MSLAWLRTHARNRDRRARSRSNSIRGAAQRAHRQFAGAEAYAPRVEYDNSFVVDRSTVTSKDANWLTDEQYKRQYRRLGWDVAPIRKDGNCLFRALSDQLYGHERRHLELRRRLVDFINLEQAFFEPFVAGEGVMEYCARLREAGAWGGHPELVAASRLLGVNIIVHTGPVKRLRIDTDKYAISKEGKGRTINLLLKHDHYSSLHKRDKPISQQHGCVVLFQPESLAPVVKPKAPLVVLFEPETAPASKPAPTPVSKKTPVNTATPSKPKVGAVLEVEVEEPESISGGHDEMPECGVHRPRRAIFNGGRRRSSGAAFTLMQEMSISLNVSRPVAVADVKPKLPNARSVEVKKSSKKVFRQGRPVTAAC
ncbi:hypothetical protein JM18_008048 [Phytophthora kernoviae]|uniref:OTU domain-containing protein 1 n=2 Tax=Phytophthora kernoviae TaxID=325452 RepID=A0A8T0LN56_9STRA|nr:hypothetical protein G195_009621 [Phytophthora kernoviae 00238/432]KAG2511660.1 hypothetical protein JM16_008172 [Phytophthora kernoviae]KAG2515385.1 hypothetical protein JM18_008048 [Phytophthora kernoviae]